MSTDLEFAAWLRSLPRGRSAAEVESIEQQHDAERGPYVAHGGTVHHLAQESRH